MSVTTNSKAGFPQPGLDAAREGRAWNGFVNGLTGIAAETIITDAAFIQPIPFGRRLVMTCFYIYLSTASDWVTAEWIVTENEDGSGGVTVLTVRFRLDTGAALAATSPTLVPFDPPLVVSRTHGKALTARVQGNDAAAALTLGFHGWWEQDTGVN